MTIEEVTPPAERVLKRQKEWWRKRREERKKLKKVEAGEIVDRALRSKRGTIEIKHPTEGSRFYDLPLGWKRIGEITITETGEKKVK